MTEQANIKSFILLPCRFCLDDLHFPSGNLSLSKSSSISRVNCYSLKGENVCIFYSLGPAIDNVDILFVPGKEMKGLSSVGQI